MMKLKIVAALMLTAALTGAVLEESADAQLLRRRCCVTQRCRPLLARLAARRCQKSCPTDSCCRKDPVSLDCCYTQGSCDTCDVDFVSTYWRINSTDCAANCYCPVPITDDEPFRAPVTCAPKDHEDNTPSLYSFQVGFGGLSGGNMPESGALFCRPTAQQGEATTSPIVIDVDAYSAADFTMKVNYNPSGYPNSFPIPGSGPKISIHCFASGLGGGMLEKREVSLPTASGQSVDVSFGNFEVTFTRN